MHATIGLVPTAKKGDPVNFPSYPHEVLAVVLSVRDGRLCVLLWKRARSPYRGRWALPGGGVEPTERLRDAITGHLATKVDLERFPTKQDLREGLDGARRHAEVLFETVRDDIRLVAEGLASLIERLERKGII